MPLYKTVLEETEEEFCVKQYEEEGDTMSSVQKFPRYSLHQNFNVEHTGTSLNQCISTTVFRVV